MAPKRQPGQRQGQLWLRAHMNPYFFVAMRDEPEALVILARELDTLRHNRRILLADRPTSLILATVSTPGSLYDTLTLRNVAEREISYAMFAHSAAPLPGQAAPLEIQRFEFDRKRDDEISGNYDVEVPAAIQRRINGALRQECPGLARHAATPLLNILWSNNPGYVRISPPIRVARTLFLFHEARQRGGLYLDCQPLDDGSGETRVAFAVGNPPQRDFLQQVLEVFHRLDLGISRAYCLTVSDGIHPYFLSTFYVRGRDGAALTAAAALGKRLREELCNTQLLATTSPVYGEFVAKGVMSGAEASLVDAFICFCHTSLAHSQPDRYDLVVVRRAFHANPQLTRQLVGLFRLRFDPEEHDRDVRYPVALADAEAAVAGYHTGRRHLDETRRTIFGCALLLIRHTLKSNACVLEKQALAFRLDPVYLSELGAEFTADLPAAPPFRVTFFFSRAGFAYHVGFSDIARGGWRTVIARSQDDLLTGAATLFRETFVLAHTQHAKNKDIYEGGSKLVALLDTTDLQSGSDDAAVETIRLYKLQYGIASAFFDLFVTRDGVASHPAVVDYYRDDEAIELGPDENMHDIMVEEIARMARRRGYLLGAGIMSSKQVGINHKEFGVTSTGVVTFAEITMAELGIDLRRDPCRVKLTGGPNGDVAGNAIRLLLERAPQVQLVLILDGSAALVDPAGASHDELRRILLRHDLAAFDPQALHPGGMLLYRSGSRKDGLCRRYRKVTRTADGLSEEWISSDEFAMLYGELIFNVPADLFIPAGGRPETIDDQNWARFLAADGTPSARAIVEGANSFLTPQARLELQRRGVLIMRDAAANKCGVISSSYEIIANLLLDDAEFLAHKGRYVDDVLAILVKRAGDEARLILKRRRDHPECLCTEISDALSSEINSLYARLFAWFQAHPERTLREPYRRALLAHLPAMLRDEPRFRRRLRRLPPKYRAAILAAEIGSSLIYRGDRDADFLDLVQLHLQRNFSQSALLEY
jgi:glutamate dehydrogenase